MRGPGPTFLTLSRVAATVLILGACGQGDADRADAAGPGEEALPPGVDAALALSTDPVDQLNFILAKATEPIPGGTFEARHQVRLRGPDTLVIDHEYHRLGESWPPAQAWTVGRLANLDAQVDPPRSVNLVCGEPTCLEFQGILDSLELARLPEGPEGDWFRTFVVELASGEADVASLGGVDALNRRLKETARHYSETVRTWYQVDIRDEWMDLEIWQQAQGFPENLLPTSLRIHLPRLQPMGPGLFGCSESPCVLEVADTPFTAILAGADDAERFVEHFGRLRGEG